MSTILSTHPNWKEALLGFPKFKVHHSVGDTPETMRWYHAEVDIDPDQPVWSGLVLSVLKDHVLEYTVRYANDKLSIQTVWVDKNNCVLSQCFASPSEALLKVWETQ